MITPDKNPNEFFDMIDVLAIKPQSTYKSFKAMLRITFSEHKIAIFELEGEPEDGDTGKTMVFFNAVSCHENLHEDVFDRYFRGDFSEYLPKGKMIHRIVKNAAVVYLIQKTCEDFVIEQKTFTLDELTDRIYKFLQKAQAELAKKERFWRESRKACAEFGKMIEKLENENKLNSKS
jgi:hypothetical protein